MKMIDSDAVYFWMWNKCFVHEYTYDYEYLEQSPILVVHWQIFDIMLAMLSFSIQSHRVCVWVCGYSRAYHHFVIEFIIFPHPRTYIYTWTHTHKYACPLCMSFLFASLTHFLSFIRTIIIILQCNNNRTNNNYYYYNIHYYTIMMIIIMILYYCYYYHKPTMSH